MAVEAKFSSRRRRPEAIPAASDSLDDVYSLKIGAIWQRMRQEPLHFWLFCGYIFFEYVRPQTIYPVINVLPWGRLFILAALFAVLVDRNSSKSLASPLTFPVLGTLAITFFSFTWAFVPSLSLSRYDVLVNWVLLYVLFLWIVNTRFRIFIVFMILLLASFKMAQHGFRVSVSRGFAFQRWGIGGPSGWFTNAADLGVQMAIYTAWSVAFYYGLKQYWQSRLLRWLVLLFPVAGVATALATNQRNTTLAFAAMAIAFILFSKNRLRNLVLVGTAALVVFSLAPPEFKARFENAEQSGTAQSRLELWGRGVDIWKNNPVLGVGHHNFAAYVAAHYPGYGLSHVGSALVAHSVPVTVAAETGTVGFLFYYTVALMVLILNIRSARIFRDVDPPFWRYFAHSLNFGLIGFLVAGVFLSIAFYPFLWVQAGLTACLHGIATREQAARTVTAARIRRSVMAATAHADSVVSRVVRGRRMPPGRLS
jgi:putative inorganic carbon (hco3(-)) transporter